MWEDNIKFEAFNQNRLEENYAEKDYFSDHLKRRFPIRQRTFAP